MYEIKKVNKQEASDIINNREPLGLFYILSKVANKKIYTGIDNNRGDAWTEEFESLYYCKRWLMGYFNVDEPTKEASKMDKRKVPYPYPADMARQYDEIHLYRESFQANKACAEMIEKVIQASRYEDNGYDLRAAVNDVINAYGTERMNWVLANTLQNNDYDRRFSRSNTEWGKAFAIPKDSNMSSYEIKSHPEHLNNFIKKAREICSELHNAPK